MSDFLPATVTGYAEWPKNTPNYYALPAYADVVGWTYRKDWFDRPEIQAEFKAKYGRDLGVPKTQAELKKSVSSSKAVKLTAKRSTALRSTLNADQKA